MTPPGAEAPHAPAGARALCAALVLIALIALLAAEPARAQCKLQQMEIPVRMVNQRPIATLKLNGTDVPMLVDSGAFFSMLSASTATQLNLPTRNLPQDMRVQGYAGRIDVMRTRVDRVQLLGAELRDVDFLVGGNELGAGIMGILGRNILAMADTEYDLAHGAVRLTFPNGDCGKTHLAHWAGDAPVVVVPLEQEHSDDTAPRVQVLINGKRTLALLDTGAPHSALTLRAARRAGIEARELQPQGRVSGAGEALAPSWTGPVASFELGGEKVTNNVLRIDDTDMPGQAMLLGLDYFLSHRIYVSRLQRQIYLTWNGSKVFVNNRSSAAASQPPDPRYAAVPQELPRDNADALARRGEAAMAAGNFQRALEDLNRACELAPTVADCFFARARAHLELRQPQPALADLDEALRLNPGLHEARMRRAFVRAALGDRSGAQGDLLRLDVALPASSALRAEMAELHARYDHAGAALRQFELWIGTHPKDAYLPSMLHARCHLRARLGMELPLALQDCQDAASRDKGHAVYHQSLGWVYLRLGDAARARRAFDNAIELEALPLALYGRGVAYQRQGDTERGERDLASARKLRPLIDDDVREQGFDGAGNTMPPRAPGH